MLVVVAMVAMCVVWMHRRQDAFTEESKATCRDNTKRSVWGDYDWQTRRWYADTKRWGCPKGWEDTKCDWGMGNEFQKKQCRRKKSVRAEKEDTSKCTSNVDCEDGRRCSYYGYCHGKESLENAAGTCSRNSHCRPDRACVGSTPNGPPGTCRDPEPAPAPLR